MENFAEIHLRVYFHWRTKGGVKSSKNTWLMNLVVHTIKKSTQGGQDCQIVKFANFSIWQILGKFHNLTILAPLSRFFNCMHEIAFRIQNSRAFFSRFSKRITARWLVGAHRHRWSILRRISFGVYMRDKLSSATLAAAKWTSRASTSSDGTRRTSIVHRIGGTFQKWDMKKLRAPKPTRTFHSVLPQRPYKAPSKVYDWSETCRRLSASF